MQPGELDGRIEHVRFVRGGHARDHRQVDDADVVGLAVFGDPFDGCDDVRDVRRAAAVADLDADDVRVGCTADVLAIVIGPRQPPAASGDDAGDKGAVAVIVLAGRGGTQHAIEDLRDPLGAQVRDIGAQEVRVTIAYAAVDDGDADTCAA